MRTTSLVTNLQAVQLFRLLNMAHLREKRGFWPLSTGELMLHAYCHAEPWPR